MSYTMAQASAVLRRLGFRVRTSGEYRQVVATFQAGYALGAPLAADGACGPATSAALARSSKSGGLASAHFAWAEFACRCGGRYANCRRIIIARTLLIDLEKYRTKAGHPVTIVSGYRCVQYNASIDGAPDSQHVRGTAADVSDGLKVPTVRALGFTGIGRGAASGNVLHVDVRAGGFTTWTYPGW